MGYADLFSQINNFFVEFLWNLLDYADYFENKPYTSYLK
jgi:hypothetical protein